MQQKIQQRPKVIKILAGLCQYYKISYGQGYEILYRLLHLQTIICYFNIGITYLMGFTRFFSQYGKILEGALLRKDRTKKKYLRQNELATYTRKDTIPISK